MAELKTRISLKYDTLVNWQKSTLKLNKGELAIAVIPAADPANKQLPPVMFKVGDGEHTFAELGNNWASALAADVYEWAKAASRPAYKYGDADLTGFGTAAAKNVGDFDKAGAAATAEANAKAYVDEQIGSIPTAAEYTLETGTTDGSLVLKKNGIAVGDPAVVKGWAELLEKANSSVKSVSLAGGTKNGTLKLTVDGTATDNIAVTGLGSAAYKAATDFDAAGEAAKVLGTDTDDATKNTVYGAKFTAQEARSAAEGAQTSADEARQAAENAQSTANGAQTAAEKAKQAADQAQSAADDASMAAQGAQTTIDNYQISNDEALAAVKKTADAAQTSAQVDAKISTHNTSSTAHADIRGEITALSEKVSGRATNYVYKNDQDAAYKTAIGKAGSFIVGDTIYFTDTNISDQWVIKVNAAAPYYEFQDIETEKPSFDGYVKGTGLTADKLVLGNTGSNVKASAYGISETLTATDKTNLPTSKAVADYVTTQMSAKQDNLSETQLAAVNSGITKAKVGTYDGYATSKQNALSEDQLAAVDSGITAEKVGKYDGYATSKQDKIDADHKISADFVSGLGAAAKKGVASSVTAAGVDLPTAAAVASYVGAEIDKISIPTVNNAALKDASGATIFTANASADVQILVIDCGNASGWDA